MKKFFAFSAALALVFSMFTACEADKVSGQKSDDKDNNGQYGGEVGDDNGGVSGDGGAPNYNFCSAWSAKYHGREYIESIEQTIDVVSVSGVSDPFFAFSAFPDEVTGTTLSSRLDAIYQSCLDGDYIYALTGPSDFDFLVQMDNGDYFVYIIGIGDEDTDYGPTGNYGKFKITVDGSAYDNEFGDLEQYLEEGGGGEGGESDLQAPSKWTLKSGWTVNYVAYEEAYDIYYLAFSGITDNYFTAEIYDSRVTTKADMDEYFLFDAEWAINFPDSYLLVTDDPEWNWQYFYGDDYYDMPGEKYVYIVGIDYDNDAVTGNYGEVLVDFSESVVYDGRYDEYFEVSAAAANSSRVVRVKGSSAGKPSRKAVLGQSNESLRINRHKVFVK